MTSPLDVRNRHLQKKYVVNISAFLFFHTTCRDCGQINNKCFQSTKVYKCQEVGTTVISSNVQPYQWSAMIALYHLLWYFELQELGNCRSCSSLLWQLLWTPLAKHITSTKTAGFLCPPHLRSSWWSRWRTWWNLTGAQYTTKPVLNHYEATLMLYL